MSCRNNARFLRRSFASDGRADSLRDGVSGTNPLVDKKLSCFRGASRTLDDAKVAFRSGTECLKRLLVCLASMSTERGLVAIEFDKYRPQLQSGLVGFNPARRPGQKTSAE